MTHARQTCSGPSSQINVEQLEREADGYSAHFVFHRAGAVAHLHGVIVFSWPDGLVLAEPLDEGQVLGASKASELGGQMMLEGVVHGPRCVDGLAAWDGSVNIHSTEGMTHHGQSSELHRHFLLCWTAFAQQPVRLPPIRVVVSVGFGYELQSIRGFGDIACHIPHEAMRAVTALHVATAVKQRLQQVEEGARALAAASGQVWGRPARQKLCPEQYVNVQRASGLELEAQAPMGGCVPDRPSSDSLHSSKGGLPAGSEWCGRDAYGSEPSSGW